MLEKNKPVLRRIVGSIWFFPAILFAIVLIMSSLQLNGSSMGVYHDIFYGDTVKDPNLLLNEPREVRSDEWLVTTQLTLAQTNSGMNGVNPNLGNGSDFTLIVDAPYWDYTQLFKPHNLGFFVLPVGVAFALKWWLMGYFLIVSVYFFVLTILPKRKKLAIVISLAFVASPFIQWWYQYITLAPVYMSLFGIVVAIKLIHAKSAKEMALWGVALVYIAVSFMVVLYPPFQIACFLVALAFLVGHTLDSSKQIRLPKKTLIYSAIGVICSVVAIGLLLFLPKIDAISSMLNTAYPGKRVDYSGGSNFVQFLASNTNILLQSDERAGGWVMNQSESSNFLLVSILLIPVVMYLLIRYRRRLPYYYTTLTTLFVSSVFLVWLFIPNVPIIGSILLLDKVPNLRLLAGFGIINVIIICLTIAFLSDKKIQLPRYSAALYALFILGLYLVIDLYLASTHPQFIGYKWAIVLAFPFAFIVYLMLTRRFASASLALFAFSLASTFQVHPLYRGVDTMTENQLSSAISQIAVSDPGRLWVAEGIVFENLPILNNAKSLGGVYTYPQLELWESIGREYEEKYNRYSHVHFEFDSSPDELVEPAIKQPGGDQMVPSLEPCDPFLNDRGVGYIITYRQFTQSMAPCATLSKSVVFPSYQVYIYKLNFNG